jgi:hypothetical protein
MINPLNAIRRKSGRGKLKSIFNRRKGMGLYRDIFSEIPVWAGPSGHRAVFRAVFCRLRRGGKAEG